MKIKRLQHVSLRIGDLQRSREFYERLLGLGLADRPDFGFPGAWYEAGGTQIHLIGGGKVRDGIDPTDPHLALEVESLDEIRRELDARGVAYFDFGGPQLWVHDPDGNVIELCEARG